MSKENEAQYGAILEFLGCSPALSGPKPTEIDELGDGVALFEFLSEMSPSHFDPTTIARHLGDNWALKSSNLRKLIRNLESYYHDVLAKDADFSTCVNDVPSISKHTSPEAISSLFELVVAAAVECDDRVKFVGRIMDMDGNHQMEMKEIIERGMARTKPYDHPEGNINGNESGEGADEEDEMVFDDFSYDIGGGANGVSTPASYNKMMNDMSSPNFGSPIAPSSVLFRSHLGDRPSMMDGDMSITSPADINTVLKEREDLRRALQDARRELAAFKSQTTLTTEETESAQRKLRSLADDLQARLSQRQDELTVTEDELSKVKRQLEDATTSVADLTEKNALMADELDLANAKAAQLRKAEATVVAYRKKLESVGVMNQQMTELEDQSAGYLRQIVNLENEVKAVPVLQKRVEEVQIRNSKLEKEKLESDDNLKMKAAEVSRLKDELSATEKAKKMYEEELAEVREQKEARHFIDDDLDSTMVGLTLTSAKSVSEAKEKAIRLEIENKKLVEKVAELESSAAGEATSSDDVSALRATIKRLKDELKKGEVEKEKIVADKEKLEAYTKKTLAKFQEKYLVALQECKAKMKEKHDKIEALEMRGAAEKNAQKREERLLSSTIYELGLAIMQQRLKERQT